MTDIAKHPGIARACQLVALDNGGINRFRSVEKQSRQFNAWLAKQEYPNLAELDQWFAALSEDELELFCCGGTGEPEADAFLAKAPAFADDLLTQYFEEVC